MEAPITALPEPVDHVIWGKCYIPGVFVAPTASIKRNIPPNHRIPRFNFFFEKFQWIKRLDFLKILRFA